MTDTMEEQFTAEDNLGAMAAEGLASDDGSAQPALVDGKEGAKVRFAGVAYNDIDETLKMGDEVSFIVTGRVIGDGKEEMADGHLRHNLKVKVRSVTLDA